jgi:hypothetical protein
LVKMSEGFFFPSIHTGLIYSIHPYFVGTSLYLGTVWRPTLPRAQQRVIMIARDGIFSELGTLDRPIKFEETL